MINFLKNSLFQHKNKEQPNDKHIHHIEPRGAVLAVWGSPSSGKTTVAVKLAQYIASHKQDVALLLCDMTAPPLPCICSPSELQGQVSLGSILAQVKINSEIVQKNATLHKKYEHLAAFGLLKGENEYTYPIYNVEQVHDLLLALKELVPNVVIDCTSTFANDILSTVSLLSADAVLRLMACDLKSVSYFSSQLPILMESEKWRADRQYLCASNVKFDDEVSQIEQASGINAAFSLRHSDELKKQVLSGEMFRDLTLKESRQFNSEIAKIAKEVFGI